LRYIVVIKQKIGVEKMTDFDYKKFFEEHSMRDYAVAIVLRAMADNGYMGERAVAALSEPLEEITVQKLPDEAGVHQIFMHFDGNQLSARYSVSKDGHVTFEEARLNDRHTHIDEIDFINYWYPTYFPEGKVSARVAEWYAIADRKLKYID
jgi:hypothetical protein